MPLRPRTVLFLLLCVLTAGVVAGCGGGDDGKSASSSTDVNQLLKDTFSGGKTIKSGNVNLTVRIDAKGGSSSTQGPISVALTGPFQSQGEGKLPKLDLEAKIEGAGQNISAVGLAAAAKGVLPGGGPTLAGGCGDAPQGQNGHREA